MDRKKQGASGRITRAAGCRIVTMRWFGDVANRQMGVPADRESKWPGLGDGKGFEAS